MSSKRKTDPGNGPNILWITCEDIGPHLGCYDAYSTTPNLDRLAQRGVVYHNAWSNAPVCAPARTGIISGIYPPSCGAEHMRSMVPIPDSIRLYPEFLRERGYYCTNNQKEDFNISKNREIWDECSGQAHWQNRGEEQPFFAIFNLTQTHENQIRNRNHRLVHDPEGVDLPAYHPDTPEAREDWAHYYSSITAMDSEAGRYLEEIEEADLLEDTIIFFYGDHGSGMPRNKRFCYNSGLCVAFVVYVPEKYRHLAPDDYTPGGESQRLISFVDLAPTLLSIVDIQPPDYMQGRAFMGHHEREPREYLYGFRGRMDERYDLVRAIRDDNHLYIRNYMPHLPAGQHVEYMFRTATTRQWKELYDRGELNPVQARFWDPKAPEELYDLQNDPDEVHNLAASPDHQGILARHRFTLDSWQVRIRDIGLLPEPEVHRLAEDSTPYETGHDREQYPVEQVMEVAREAIMLAPEALPRLTRALESRESGVRYWGAMGILMRGRMGLAAARPELLKRMKNDRSDSVKIAAAHALAQHGHYGDRSQALKVLLDYADPGRHNVWLSLTALNALDTLDKKTDFRDNIRDLSLPEGDTDPWQARAGGCLSNLITRIARPE